MAASSQSSSEGKEKTLYSLCQIKYYCCCKSYSNLEMYLILLQEVQGYTHFGFCSES